MAAFRAPTYWKPRFFAMMISLGAWATTYSLSGCYSILDRIGPARYIRSEVARPTLSEHQHRSSGYLGPDPEPIVPLRWDVRPRLRPVSSRWGLIGLSPSGLLSCCRNSLSPSCSHEPCPSTLQQQMPHEHRAIVRHVPQMIGKNQDQTWRRSSLPS